ncbi:glutaredoxin family protein [Paucibacter sp. M5-1]|uniref:glutaredoxin family protein n=1 Tax=Paucibacter sp. M5-1 TaxID=3015998 RepID=UPI0022B92432|nr:glutaredoxin family protein [Paucibacter sp. M5-1]MCZ7883718.1 glutaredoxin family protein [Paucibacter sp. M5-1]
MMITTGPVKQIAAVIAILAGGFSIGWGATKLPSLLRPAYEVGDFSSHFPDRDVQVVVYGTASCSFCKSTRRYLSERGIRFVDRDVQKSTAAASAYASLGGGGVPLVVIGERLIRGYHPDAFESALASLK